MTGGDDADDKILFLQCWIFFVSQAGRPCVNGTYDQTQCAVGWCDDGYYYKDGGCLKVPDGT